MKPIDNFIKEIQGSSILNFKWGKETIDLEEKFLINVRESKFRFECKNNLEFLENIEHRFFDDCIEEPFLYCYDEDHNPFTLLGCYAWTNELPLKSISISWERLIYGAHISNENTMYIKKLSCIVENDKISYRCSALSTNCDIQFGKISLEVGLNHFDENKFYGIRFDLYPNEKMSFNEIKESLYRTLEIYFLYIGYFANIKEIKVIHDENELIYFTSSESIYKSIDKNVELIKNLHPVDFTNISKQYDSWIEIRKANIPVITMFINALNNKDNYIEVNTSILIQCLEGYFRTHHGKKLERYSDTIKTEIFKTVITLIEESKSIDNLIEKNKLEKNKIINSMQSLLGSINKMSLAEVLIFASDYTSKTKKIFNYEKTLMINDKETAFTKFIRKATKHRNFLSHLTPEENYFKGWSENKFAKEKLELLLRVIILYDIGLEIQEKCLDRYIETLNKRYYER